MYLRLDFNIFIIFLWRLLLNKVVRLICDVYFFDGILFFGCLCGVLKKMFKKVEEMGYKFFVGLEIEFFLFFIDENGNLILQIYDQGGYFDLVFVDLGEDVRRDMVFILEEMGFEIEVFYYEVVFGQYEIDFKYDDVFYIVDNVVIFKFVVKIIV